MTALVVPPVLVSANHLGLLLHLGISRDVLVPSTATGDMPFTLGTCRGLLLGHEEQKTVNVDHDFSLTAVDITSLVGLSSNLCCRLELCFIVYYEAVANPA